MMQNRRMTGINCVFRMSPVNNKHQSFVWNEIDILCLENNYTCSLIIFSQVILSGCANVFSHLVAGNLVSLRCER